MRRSPDTSEGPATRAIGHHPRHVIIGRVSTSANQLIERIESYYAAIDRFDTPAIVAHFTPTATMRIATDNVSHIGLEAIASTYDRRAELVDNSFHGHFTHVVDAAGNRATTRLEVVRTTPDGETTTLDCIALFAFEGELIADLVIWMSGENTLR